VLLIKGFKYIGKNLECQGKTLQNMKKERKTRFVIPADSDVFLLLMNKFLRFCINFSMNLIVVIIIIKVLRLLNGSPAAKQGGSILFYLHGGINP
jgi:hypothetical protein